jgi:hypothetical protein
MPLPLVSWGLVGMEPTSQLPPSQSAKRFWSRGFGMFWTMTFRSLPQFATVHRMMWRATTMFQIFHQISTPMFSCTLQYWQHLPPRDLTASPTFCAPLIRLPISRSLHPEQTLLCFDPPCRALPSSAPPSRTRRPPVLQPRRPPVLIQPRRPPVLQPRCPPVLPPRHPPVLPPRHPPVLPHLHHSNAAVSTRSVAERVVRCPPAAANTSVGFDEWERHPFAHHRAPPLPR